LDAVWLGYCSKDYFNRPSNQTGLQLATGTLSDAKNDFTTNLATCWPNSTLPQSVTGWSRNWWILNRTNSDQPIKVVKLSQYPNGYKRWQFTASDPVQVGGLSVPQQLTLEAFFPKPPGEPTNGDDTLPLRRVTFTADSIKVISGGFNPFPAVPVPDLEVMDERFQDVASPYVITSHATPKGWPVRGSDAFKKAAAHAADLAAQNPALIAAQKAKTVVIVPPE